MPIRALPPHLVNQIAAGEVVERPASVVKELVENAIDAGATRVQVSIEAGGKELVRVRDDGAGIAPEELTLAVAPHATSKIAEAEDLVAIATMGFRGEALASIASVSRLAITSRTADAEAAHVIEVDGGELRPPRPVAGPPGTTVAVRTLFFNVPARRKFLKSDVAESTRVGDVVRGLALAHPTVGFRLEQEGRVRLDVPPEQPALRRVLAVLGEELEPELLEVVHDEGGVRVRGLAGRPSLARPTAKSVRLVLNGRVIADRTAQHAVREGYRGLLEPTRWPTAVLYLQVDPSRVDVNVHPAKTEVRFRDGQVVHAAIRHALKQALRDADLVPEIELPEGGVRTAVPPVPAARFGSGVGRSAPAAPGSPPFAGPRGFDAGAARDAIDRAPAPFHPSAPAASPESEAEPRLLPSFRPVERYLQIDSSFLAVADADGLLLVDQHALHERVMFERLRTRVESGPLESQALLVPVPVPLESGQAEALETLAPLLARLGIEADLLDPRTVALRAFPALLFERKVDPAAFMRELLAKAADDELAPSTEGALHEVLDMMACKAAIKAGERLPESEIEALLREGEAIERAGRCPHGRPTTLRLTVRELERRFGRS